MADCCDDHDDHGHDHGHDHDHDHDHDHHHGHDHGDQETFVPPAPTPELFAVASYLQNPKSLRPRMGILNGKRASYFKGQSAVKALLKPEYNHTSRPPVNDHDDAYQLLHNMLLSQFFLKVSRSEPPANNGPRSLRIERMQNIEEEAYYAWIYQGSQVGTMVGGIVLIGIVFAGVMFPLWPQFMREGAWYLSVLVLALLGLLFGIAIVRLILYVVTLIVLPKAIWIFPNLFEDVGFVDSFIPFWAFDEVKKKKKKEVVSKEE